VCLLLLLTMTLIATKWLHKTSRLCFANCAWQSSISSTLRNTSSAAPAQSDTHHQQQQ
jgi:hypothetical protein